MTHKTHSYFMVGLLVVGAALFFSGGVDGGALFLLWPLVCMGMMAAMMFGMSGMGGMSRRPEHTHDDGVTHSHPDLPAHTRNQTADVPAVGAVTGCDRSGCRPPRSRT